MKATNVCQCYHTPCSRANVFWLVAGLVESRSKLYNWAWPRLSLCVSILGTTLTSCRHWPFGIRPKSQRSSVVEQRFRKPSVKSSTLFAGSSSRQQNDCGVLVVFDIRLLYFGPLLSPRSSEESKPAILFRSRGARHSTLLYV